MSLSAVSHPWDVNERIPPFTGISLRVVILSGIKGIQRGKEDLRYDFFSNDRGVWRSESIVKNLYYLWITAHISQKPASKIFQHTRKQEYNKRMLQPLFQLIQSTLHPSTVKFLNNLKERRERVTGIWHQESKTRGSLFFISQSGDQSLVLGKSVKGSIKKWQWAGPDSM